MTNYQKRLKQYHIELNEHLRQVEEAKAQLDRLYKNKAELGLGADCEPFSTHNDLEVFVEPLRINGVVISGGWTCYCRAERTLKIRVYLDGPVKPIKFK